MARTVAGEKFFLYAKGSGLMVCVRHALMLTAFGVLFLPAVVLGQVQAPKIQIHTGVPSQALSNSDLQDFEERDQEVVGYHLMFSDEQNSFNPSPEVAGVSGGELLRRTFYPPPFARDLSTGASEPPANAGELAGDRWRNLQQTFGDAQNSLTILEGNSKTFKIRLDAQPSGTVTGTITGHAGTDLEVTPTQLTFNDSNWNVERTVTVKENHDSDDTHENVTLTFTILTNSTTGSVSQDIHISILDDERPWKFAPLELFLGDKRFRRIPLLRALGPPSGDVTFTITGHENTSLLPDQTTLIFRRTQWRVSQRLGLTSTSHTNNVDEHLTLTFTASGGGYTGLKYTMDVTILYDPPWTLLIPEGGTASQSLRLVGRPPLTPPTITVTGQENTDLTVNPEQWTYNIKPWDPCIDRHGNDNYCSGPQPVIYAATEDSDDVDDQILLRFTVGPPGHSYENVNQLMLVRIEDNDDPGLVVNPSSLQIHEGSSKTFTVKLSDAPLGDLGSNDVTVRIPFYTGDLTVDKTRLRFTTSNWDTEQTVTLTAAEDDDSVNETGTLWMTASGGGYDRERGSVDWEIIDDDTAGLVVSSTLVELDEGTSETLWVKLSESPTGNVAVSISVDQGTDGVLDLDPVTPTTLTFTSLDWDQEKDVIFTAQQDGDYDDESETLTLTASGGFSDTKTVIVRIKDDDTPGLVVRPVTVTVDEGATATFTVELEASPANDVTVSISVDQGIDGELDLNPVTPMMLTFTSSDWDQEKTVMLTAKHDADFNDESETLTLTATGSFSDTETVNVTIIDDDDEPDLVVTPTSVEVGEGESAIFTVELDRAPANDVTVVISGYTDTDLDTLVSTPRTLTFNSSDWGAKAVTIGAKHDADFSDESETLTLTATGGLSATETVNVTIIDDDEPDLVVIPASVTVDEGESATFTVELEGAPSGDVDVVISGYTGTDLDTTASDPRTLTFTPSDWDAQTVTLGTKHDADFVNDTETLTLTATGGLSATETVNVTIIDDDEPDLVVTPASVTVDEGESATFTVELDGAPSGDVDVVISGYTGTDLDTTASDPRTLTFTPSDWDVQTVTLGTKHDADFVNDTETLTLTATGGSTDTKTVSVTITDDDEPGLVVTPESVNVAEGATATFTVELEGAPSSNIAVEITGYAGTDLDIEASAPRKLTFTSSDWDAETVTLGAKHDNDFVNDAATLTLTTTDGSTDTKTVSVTIKDDDIPGLVVTPASVTIAEGKTATFTARLEGQPSGNVTVTVPTPVGDLTAVPSVLRFTVGNWSIPQPVTLRAAQDDDGVADETEVLRLTASGAEYDGVTAEVRVTIKDDGQAGIVVSPPAVTVTEGGLGSLFTISLSAAPTANVTVTLRDDGTSDLRWSGSTLTGSALTFTPANYGTQQTVTLTAEEDDDGLADETEILLLTATGAAEYAGKTGEITVTIRDDEQVDIVVSPSVVTVDEGGINAFTVRLSEAPAADVTVTLRDDGTSDLRWSGSTLASNALTFTPANYHTPQTVILSAAEDADILNETETLRLTASGADYAGVTADVTVTIEDNDRGTIAAPGAVTMTEGSTQMFTVSLRDAPAADVTVTLSGYTGTDLAGTPPSPLSLTFTPADYGIPQTVTLSAAEDPDILDEEDITLHLSASGAGYAGVTTEVTVTIEDDDEGTIMAPDVVPITEGGTTTFDVSLRDAPSANVTVTTTGYAGTNLADTPPSPLNLIFTPLDYHLPQSVTLTAEDDHDMLDEDVTLYLSASGAEYTGKTANVTVTITDNDAAGIVVPASVTMEEGSERTLEVVLTQMPLGPVTVTFSGHAGTDLSLNGSPLTFTPANWSQEQTVTLAAAEDHDLEHETETLTLTASGGGYNEVDATVTVTITDNDAAGLVAPEAVQMDEGGTYPLLVRLSAQPSGPATVTFSGHAGTDLALDKTSLTFTTTDWQTSKPVTLTAMQDDDDYADDTVGLTLTASGGGYDKVEAMVTVTITDNDERPGPLTVTIYDEQELENEGAIQLPIELSRPVDQVVTVQYASTDGTAEAGEDYITSRGIVIFDPGATRGVIEIEVIDDELPEEHETFMVTLSKPRNAIIARETGTGTILDDDGASAILRVEDALVLEEEGMVRFRVLLSHPQRQMISAAYRTRDGTAKAGEDYEASSGVVTLAPGTVEAMIAVPLLKDGLDWREETFTVHLESSKHAEIAKAVGVATIQESTTVSEEVLEAYAARFVRTSSVQVVEALGERFRSGADGAACGAADRAEMARLWYAASSWDPSLGELLAGCRMSATSYSGSFSVWGRGAFRQFNGRDDDALTLRGEVTTGMLGADYRWRGGWLAGLLLAHSQGEGSFEVVQQSGEITAGLTGVYPYVSYARAGWDVWMSAGAGRGQAEVLELKGDLVSRFGAMGVRGKLMSSGTIGLNYHGDVLVTDAEIKEHEVTAEVYRVRAGVEANVKISDGLHPFLEANVRSDGGSAETGVGLEFGGGIRVAYPAWRLQADLRTQGLVMHTADGFTEWGISGSVQVGSRSQGLMMRVRPSWGRGQGMSMYGQQTILDATPIGANAHRTKLELGYGIPWKDGTARSVMGVTQLHQGVMYRLGGELYPSEWLTFSVFGLAHGRTTSLGDIGVNVRGSLRY